MEQPKEGLYYQLQYRRCGRSNCLYCKNGPSHGPYWYAYWYEGPRLRSRYVGKAATYTLDAALLKRARLLRHWTQSSVARAIGIPQSSYAGWEEGKHLPRDYARRKLVALFGLSQEELGFTEHRRR